MGGKKKGKGKKGGDPAKGQSIFKSLCTQCHAMSSHSTGPALGAVYGGSIASQQGFSYSAALSGKGTMKWSDANLDKWLKSPAEFAPGNAMAFAGIPSGKDRMDVISYLKG